ncbi:MAG: alpha-amylase [Sphaerochaetaceae bacterium]|nr:alpha-amylase [Sphaerochaetaceae bacterium]
MKARDFRMARTTRQELGLKQPLFVTSAKLRTLYDDANRTTFAFNENQKKKNNSLFLSPARVYASGILHELYQFILDTYITRSNPGLIKESLSKIEMDNGLDSVVVFYTENFPSPLLESEKPSKEEIKEEATRGFFVREIMVSNPALLQASEPLIRPTDIVYPKRMEEVRNIIGSARLGIEELSGGSDEDLFSFMNRPARMYPDSLEEQIKFIAKNWAHIIGDDFLKLLESTLDFIATEEKDRGGNGGGGGAPTNVMDYSGLANEYEAFSTDTDWMPKVVMMAKCTLVWLDQLSKWYKREIRTLDQIPDHELDMLAERGFTALWLIGLWQRSDASRDIKVMCGNPDAEASAYSLKDYEISEAIGGWKALENLRERCAKRGIRLASDMVPNHTGLDSNWMYDHPEYFISQDYPPFPNYTYNGPDFSKNPDIEIKIEDHYYSKTDAAVTFLRRNKKTGEVKYVFHGNDGTSMPWNDTAQIDYLNPVAREAVIEKILDVARAFPIIRFDAAMTLAKRHIQRLWYPQPGTGGDIPGRFVHAISQQEFDERIPQEFWREVVDRVAKEVPDTLLLAEAFWMLEGYFVRTLGMHRVYNSAFMNMLKRQENEKYRLSIKNTILFDPEILKRYVNFMNNPDEDTAIAQFGDGNRYFSICTILSTLPGLPMFGHGQLEGFTEKYGMEYKRAYYNEYPNDHLIGEHYRRIFPLLRKRYLFSGVDLFNLYDAYHDGHVEESIYAYANGCGAERTLVIVNNQYERVSANIKTSCPKLIKAEGGNYTAATTLAENLGLHQGSDRFVIYDDFLSGLTYLIPSSKIINDGFSFTIDGYEAKVLWNIREVVDTDGAYKKLSDFLNGRGVKNIAIAVALLRLEPVYKALDYFRSPAFFDSLRKILSAKADVPEQRRFLLSVAEVYTKLNGISDDFDEATLSALPQKPIEVNPKALVNLTKRMAKMMSGKKEQLILSIMKEFELIVAASMLIKPFIKEESKDPREALVAVDKLLLTHFFEGWRKEKGLNDNDLHRTLHFAALFSTVGYMMEEVKDKEPIEIMAHLLESKEIREEVKCNEYRGIIWYGQELMQELIIISALSFDTFCPDKTFKSEEYIGDLLKREALALYKLDDFLA